VKAEKHPRTVVYGLGPVMGDDPDGA
jgi:hypothetical protein